MINKETNMCDGCQRGLPIDENGNHKGKGYDLMGCTADRYKEQEKKYICNNCQSQIPEERCPYCKVKVITVDDSISPDSETKSGYSLYLHNESKLDSEAWEKEFDERFSDSYYLSEPNGKSKVTLYDITGSQYVDKVIMKAFISHFLSQAILEERKLIAEEVQKEKMGYYFPKTEGIELSRIIPERLAAMAFNECIDFISSLINNRK